MARKRDFTISDEAWSDTMGRCTAVDRNISPTICELLAAYRRLDPNLEARCRDVAAGADLTSEGMWARIFALGARAYLEQAGAGE